MVKPDNVAIDTAREIKQIPISKRTNYQLHACPVPESVPGVFFMVKSDQIDNPRYMYINDSQIRDIVERVTLKYLYIL